MMGERPNGSEKWVQDELDWQKTMRPEPATPAEPEDDDEKLTAYEEQTGPYYNDPVTTQAIRDGIARARDWEAVTPKPNPLAANQAHEGASKVARNWQRPATAGERAIAESQENMARRRERWENRDVNEPGETEGAE